MTEILSQTYNPNTDVDETTECVKPPMQRFELEDWLGNGRNLLTDQQIDSLLVTAREIENRYPDDDDQDEREAALTAAYRLLIMPSEALVHQLADKLFQANAAVRRAQAGLHQVALTIVDSSPVTKGLTSEEGFASAAGVDVLTVREWLGR